MESITMVLSKREQSQFQYLVVHETAKFNSTNIKLFMVTLVFQFPFSFHL